MVLVSEIGYLGRFKHPKQLMAYLGLVPSEESSGDTPSLIADNEAGRSILGWEPKKPGLDEIIADAWQWHTAHPGGSTREEPWTERTVKYEQ